MKTINIFLKKYSKVIIIIGLCSSIFTTHRFLLSNRQEKSEFREDVTMPPALSLIVVALGPLRGLIADALWWRVSELQESSEYFEIINITEWITAMEPKNSFVWTYHAWNLAYNIAYEFPTPETRWKWIYNGLELLRDKGLKYNPGNNHIKSELAWFFLDRIGNSDPQKEYYIRQWADIMDKYMEHGERKELTGLAEAPQTAKELQLIPKVKELIDVANALELDLMQEKIFRNKENWTTSQKQLLEQEKYLGAFQKIDLFYRAEKIKNNLKLIPKRMLFIDKLYGPFQWKLPQAHAVYWGLRENEQYSQGDLNYQTIVTSAMEQAFLNGSIVRDNKTKLFVTTNNLDIAPNIVNFYMKRIKASKLPENEKNLCVTFIMNAAPILYAFGKRKTAEDLFNVCKEIIPDSNVKFSDFITYQMIRMKQSAGARYQQSLIEISLYDAYRFLSDGNDKKAEKLVDSARERWEKHQQKYGAGLLKLQPFNSIKAAAYIKAQGSLKSPAGQKRLIESAWNPKFGNLNLQGIMHQDDYSVNFQSQNKIN